MAMNNDCPVPNSELIYRTQQAQEVAEYIREKYGDEQEFLWRKFPQDSIWRNQINQKWYALLMAVPRSKLELASDELAEIIDLKFDKGAAMDFAASNEYIFPGYHMNKNNWITIILDDGMPIEQIRALIDRSYEISVAGK